MVDARKLSHTMRIDLIPDTPAEAVAAQKKIRIAVGQKRSGQTGQIVPVPQTDSHYQELLQSLYDATVITDLRGNVVDANLRALEFFQYNRDEMIGLTLFHLIHNTSEELLETLHQQLEAQRFTLIQAYCLRRGGEYFPAEIAVNRIKLAETRFLFQVRDITVRRSQEEMLRTLHTAIERARDGFAVCDAEVLLEYVNPALARMWGYEKPAELEGVDVRLLFADADAADRMVASVFSGDSAVEELAARRVDGSTFEVQISAACNRNTDGELVGLILSFVDISDRKRAEEAERDAERNRVMLESFGAACHHLGQPATVLVANLGILQKNLPDPTPLTRELVDTSVEAAETLSNVLHKLNSTSEYRTTKYLDNMGPDFEDNRIIDIDHTSPPPTPPAEPKP